MCMQLRSLRSIFSEKKLETTKPYRIANPKIGNWKQNRTETPNRNRYKTQKTNLKYGQHHKTGNPNAPLWEVKPCTKIPLFWSQPTFTIVAPGVGPLTDDITTPAVKNLKRERQNCNVDQISNNLFTNLFMGLLKINNHVTLPNNPYHSYLPNLFPT